MIDYTFKIIIYQIVMFWNNWLLFNILMKNGLKKILVKRTRAQRLTVCIDNVKKRKLYFTWKGHKCNKTVKFNLL
jgi:hypothetical protein